MRRMRGEGKRMAGKRKREGAIERRAERRRRRARGGAKETIRLLRERVRRRRRGNEGGGRGGVCGSNFFVPFLFFRSFKLNTN